MPDFEFEFNQQDKDLVVTQTDSIFGGTNYIRLTIYPTEAINNIVDLPDSSKGIDGKAIFFSTLSNSPLIINISPFTDNEKFREKKIGTGLNDFKIYKNPDGNIYIKPNEIFNTFELPQGDYKIQIDFLNQISKGQFLTEELPTPYWFEEFDVFYSGHFNQDDVNKWNSENRSDIGLMVDDIISSGINPPKYYSLPTPYWLQEFDIDNSGTLTPMDSVEWASEERHDISLIVGQHITNGTLPPTHPGIQYDDNMPIPYWFEEFDIASNFPNGDGVISGLDNIKWIDVQRPDIGDICLQITLGNIPEPPKYSDYLESQQQNQQTEDGGGGAPPEFHDSEYFYASNWEIPVDGPPLRNSSFYYRSNLDLSEYSNESEDTPSLKSSEYYFSSNFLNGDVSYKFIVKQISTSRKEVRLKILDETILNNSDIITKLTKEFNQNTDNYQFKHVLNIGTGDHIPIMNYHFDRVTDGKNNQSLILKLYEPLPGNVSNLSLITIEQEVLTTQTENLFYFSDVPDVFFGDGLVPQLQETWINPDNNDLGFQSLEELTISASIGNIEVDTLISSSQYNYPNLNVDYNEFKNHTFFGSAKKKLQNFKTKVETIQTYYSDISESLSTQGGSLTGDSNFLIQKRNDIFTKIEEEFKRLTPYEKFLYFDAQSESTSSAPSLKNYADTVPIQLDTEAGDVEFNKHDGFNTVYKHSSIKSSGKYHQHTDFFTDKYFVQKKPFFNYSSSVYLSFLMKGDSGSALTWDTYGQTTTGNGLGVPLPTSTFYQGRLINPQITGSEYRRFVYEASQSYWIPNKGIDFIDLLTVNNDGEIVKGSEITILSGSVKTGPYTVKDTSGKYPTTVVSSSGVLFSGSCMPAGELFRIYTINNLSSSLQGYWNFDSETSGSNVTDTMIASSSKGRNIEGNLYKFNQSGVSYSTPPTIADGIEVNGRQYGNSLQFTSQSSADSASAEIVFDNDDYNFSKDDNFSLSIWAKRYSIHTGSADPTVGNMQPVFTRGSTENSYGIDFDWGNDRYRAGLRGRGEGGAYHSEVAVVATLSAETSGSWHHIVMTYESGSADGLKIYLDGALANSRDTNGTTFPITASNNITASTPLANNQKLSIGTSGVLGGTGRGFSGFLQYPRVYDRAITPSEINQLYLHPDGNTETKITDVKLTLKDPRQVLPFDNVFKTTSTEWVNWYNGMLTEAENFDTDNIHSFENNLPLYIQESSDYNEMKDFLSLQGEQYDLIRNHIDSMGTLHKRGYKKTNSPPDNTLPMLLSNMGWEAINPFEGNLTETLGTFLSGITSIDDIKSNTWRKTLNNLLYIYKSKGTKNSVRALLNTYGYPPDVINFQEFGGVVESSNQDAITNNPLNNDSEPPPIPSDINVGKTMDTDLDLSTGSFNFNMKKEKLYRYRFSGRRNRILNLDWWMDSANTNTFEFIHKHDRVTNTQTILKSSGSGAETLWDLRLIPDSTGVSSSFEFRLNNSETGSLAIASNAVSMSTAYSVMKDGELWNVMLQRVTGSTSTNITNEYRLHAALQEGKKIRTYNYVTMSLSGSGTTGDKNAFANKNWMSSGSRHALSSSNLFVGESYTGSLAEIRGWSTALSTSKFRQHVLNKFSIVGNTLLSHCKELIYHFKLNENYGQKTDLVSGSGNIHTISSSTENISLIDSAHEYGDYSFTLKADVFLSSSAYGFDVVDSINPTLQDNNSNVENSNNILINPSNRMVGNLNPQQGGILSLTNKFGKKQKLNTSTKLEIYRSPQKFISDFILGKIAGFNLERKYAHPVNFYSQSYHELDTFRQDFFMCYPLTVDTNKFIRSHEKMLNHSLSEGLKKIAPARSTFSDKNSNFGIEIKPTILEKQKYEHHDHSIEANPNTGLGTIGIISTKEHLGKGVTRDTVGVSLSETIYESIKEGTIQGAPTSIGSYEVPYTDTISLGNSYVTSSGYLNDAPTKNHHQIPFLQPGGYVTTIENPYSVSINTQPTYGGSTIVTSKDGHYDYAVVANKSFDNLHSRLWGTSSADTHFINYFDSGSNNDYNTGHIENRFIFYTIGDNEHYSASMGKASDFTDASRFYNRVMMDTDFHADVSYESFIGVTNTNHTGRMLGKTRYFATSSDGTITLPRNHVSRYVDHFSVNMKTGTKNVNPGQLNVQYEDYSTASFYRVDVTGGENKIRVGSGNPSVDDGKIVYR